MKRNSIIFLTLLFTLSMAFSPLSAQQGASSAESPALWKNPVTSKAPELWKSPLAAPHAPADLGSVKFAISHGHCALPLEASVSNVNVRNTSGDLKDLQIDFEVDASSLVASRDSEGEWTTKMRRPKSFGVAAHPTMFFVCQNTKILGRDSLRLDGMMTIKGKALPASFVATPIYDHRGCGRSLQKIVLDGQVNPKDYEIWEGNVGGPDELERRLFINLAVKPNGC